MTFETKNLSRIIEHFNGEIQDNSMLKTSLINK